MLNRYEDLSLVLSANKKVFEPWKKQYHAILSEWKTLRQQTSFEESPFERTPEAEAGQARKASRKRR